MSVLRPAGDFDRSYEQDMSVLRKNWHWWVTIAALVALFTVPSWGSAYVVNTVNRLAYTIIALQGLNLLTGYCGQISLGQAAFMMVGGYLSGLMMIHWGLPIYLTIPLAAIGTGLVGLIFGLPSLRVKGFYLAMATLGAQFIIPWLSRHIYKDYLGGTSGFIELPIVEIAGQSFGEVSRFVYISLILLLITTVITTNITRTKLGRAFVSVRDNDLAAELLGVNLFSTKLTAFFIAALLAGVAGALRAHGQRGIGSEFGYNLLESITFLGMIVVGGLGTRLGPFFGAAIIILLEDVAIDVGTHLALVFPDQAAGLLASFRPIFFGFMLMLFLIFEPRGMAYRWQLIKTSWRLRPFSR
ncbi:MAG: branched-chain amino acid ABC transporter permease [Ardenticatenaceae bacterium]|nr:branched-chain amino acid ABC transporter permease [Anaerolineales bacterium]MCB9008739.1 branched-chain amino acid ABC transporter permease [Ardenticatenaceae bacterium]